MKENGLKIVFLMPRFSVPFPGACWKRIGYIASYFSKAKQRVRIVASAELGWHRKKFSIHGVNVLNLLPPTNQKFRPIRYIMAFLSCIYTTTLLTFFGGDVVILSLPQGGSESIIYIFGTFAACRILGKRIVFDYRDEWENYLLNMAKSGITRFLCKVLKDIAMMLYIKSDLTVAVTPSYCEYLRRNGVRRVCFIPNGADVVLFRPLNKEETRARMKLPPRWFIVLYSAGMHVAPYYSPEVLLKAFKEFVMTGKRSNVRLVLFGGSEKIQQLLRLADMMGLSNKVVYLGVKKSDQEIIEVIASSDVAVIPYGDKPLYKGAYPLRFFEYLACGIPVIASGFADSLLAKIINSYQVGLVVPPTDEGRLTEALEKMYLDKEFREEAGRRGRVLVEKQFDKNKLAADYLKLLNPSAKTISSHSIDMVSVVSDN
ncbi:MAG: glycosyltransferase family 4 protein [Candidatus Bathyarchaeia archaeon]